MLDRFRFHSVLPRVKKVIEANDFATLRLLMADYTAPEIADAIEDLTQEENLKLLRNLDIEFAVDIFSCLKMEMQLELFSEFKQERAVHFLKEMDPDDRTDLYQSLPEEIAEELLNQLPEEEKEEIQELVQYDENTAGGVMTPDFAQVPVDLSVSAARQIIRSQYQDIEPSWYVYVLEEDGQLAGYVTLHQLLMSNGEETIREIMQTYPIKTLYHTDQEQVAREMVKYDLLSLPVVDEVDRLLGIVTYDDVQRILEEENTEDQERFGALLVTDESYDRANTWSMMKQRLPWLMILLILSSGAAFVIEHYGKGEEIDLKLFAILVAFFPMITATAGNAGTQAATLIVRGLATGEVDFMALGLVLKKELFVGLAMGVVLGLLAFVRVAIFEDADYRWSASIIAGSTVLFILVFSTLFGGLLPMIVRRFGIDPATMSSPLITTAIDILAAFIYFNVALIIS